MVKFPLLKEQLSIEEKVRRAEHFARKMSLSTCMLYSWNEQHECSTKPRVLPIKFIEEEIKTIIFR